MYEIHLYPLQVTARMRDMEIVACGNVHWTAWKLFPDDCSGTHQALWQG